MRIIILEKIKKYFNEDIFVYANVPYEIKNYQNIIADPKNTIDFNHDSEEKIIHLRSRIGSDGALLRDRSDDIIKVNFIEKILATVIAKVSNFIPGAGIWMNTQRPEWNDANNALVGNGVSMVTLYYLRRFLKYLSFYQILKLKKVEISSELNDFINLISRAFEENPSIIKSKDIDDNSRRILMDALGKAASDFRFSIYNSRFSGDKSSIHLKDIKDFIDTINIFLEHTIDINKRDDGLYHAYNLIEIAEDSVKVSHLPEMLEGQVAILSSGYLSTEESLDILDSLKSSKLFRDDQYSYLLYPNKDLPGFLDKNIIPASEVNKSKLLLSLLKTITIR